MSHGASGESTVRFLSCLPFSFLLRSEGEGGDTTTTSTQLTPVCTQQVRPDPDSVLTKIADYVHNYEVRSLSSSLQLEACR